MLAVLAGYVSSTVYHFVVERKQRMLIKTMFSTYVNPSVVDELIMNPEKLTLGGQRKELSVMFTDIDGFTTISEQMDSQELVSLLNEYLSEMTEIVFRNDGTLDKFEGDAVVAFWGAPIAQEDHPMRACRCSLEMQNALVEIRKRWGEQNRPLLNVRIGVNTGEMVVGNMGGMGKFDYTVIGDSVNLASRLEGANKLYRTGIMVSQRTFDLVKHAIIGRELDLIMVKGRSEPLKTYELLMLSDEKVPADLHRFLEDYAVGLQFYRERKWGDAKKKFEGALLYRPGDYPTQMYIERAMEYAIHPPPVDWNGILVMTTK
jgi:adenylate cyclase